MSSPYSQGSYHVGVGGTSPYSQGSYHVGGMPAALLMPTPVSQAGRLQPLPPSAISGANLPLSSGLPNRQQDMMPRGGMQVG